MCTLPNRRLPNRRSRKRRLQIYISDDCWSCEESLRIAEEARARFEHVNVELLDLMREEAPEAVFAAPTYVLDGRVISLGNPSRERLWRLLGEDQAYSQMSGGMP
jgi:hypothetical protein